MKITMAQCRQSAHEFIQNAFSPMVAVLCSHDAEQLCQKNNLSFVEMIQPFCRMSQETTFRDPGNNTHTLKNLHIIVKDMNSSIPQPALARKMMSEAVSNSQAPADPTHGSNVMSYGNYNLQVNSACPWYEAYREMFLQVAYPSEHEFLKHFLACIYVVSSIHADPMDQFLRLAQQQHQQQHQSPSKLPKWFSPNVLKYYVLLHDVADGDEAKAESVYQAMKTTYGPAMCHLLQINSRTSVSNDSTAIPDPWSQFINKSEYRDGNIPPDLVVPTQPVSTYDSYPRSEPEPNFDHVHPVVESASEATEDSLDAGTIDHPLAQHLDEEEQLSLPRMMAEVSIPNSSSTHSLSAIDRGRSQPHGQCLSLSDHDRLRIFVHEFLIRGLIPWAERTMRILNEQIMSRKGIHRSLFSATRKWFGGGKAPLPAPGPQHNTTVIYTQEAPELQMRRFADLAFMLQQYELAYQTYHSLKKDFQNDNAWLHHAGALELASLAIFMQGSTSQRQYPHHYMESATSTYLNTCRTPQFATRATMMNTEALKSKSAYAEAAMQFIKMTSEPFASNGFDWYPACFHVQRANQWPHLHIWGPAGYKSQNSYVVSVSCNLGSEMLGFVWDISGQWYQDGEFRLTPFSGIDVYLDSDLRSALMLEQAAHCFIVMKVPMVRKFAFHMILAGHRFSKSGQRRHALRAYSQALQVYKSKGWSLAEDHINFTIGRQSFNLKQLENACSAFKHLLSRDSRQTPAQQNAFFREYIFVYKQLLTSQADDQSQASPPRLDQSQSGQSRADQSQSSLPQLPLPLVDGNRTKVLIGGLRPDRKEDSCILASGVGFSEDESATWPRDHVSGSEHVAGTWDLLEQTLAASCNGGLLPLNYQPTILAYTRRTNNTHHPHAVINEPVFVEVCLENPLRVPLVLSELHLLWQFQARSFHRERNSAPSLVISNQADSGVKRSVSEEVINTEVVPQFVIGPTETKTLQLSLTPRETGDLHLTGLAFNLGSSPAPSHVTSGHVAGSHVASHVEENSWRPSYVSTISVRGKQTLEVQGPRLNKTMAEKTSRVYGPDRRLDITVVPKMPLLDVKFYNFPEAMLCGEVRLAWIQLENLGTLPLHRLRLASRLPDFLTFGRASTIREKTVYQTCPDSVTSLSRDCVMSELTGDHVTLVPLSDGVLSGGATVSLPVWIHGPAEGGQHNIQILFYYEPLDKNPKMKYRVLRHLVRLDTKPAISLTAMAQRSLAAMAADAPVTSPPTSPISGEHGNDVTNSEEENNKNLVVDLKVENLNQPHDSTRLEFQLVQLTCISREWSLLPLSSLGLETRLNQRETSLIVCKAVPGQTTRDGDVIVTNVVFDQQQIDSTATPCADFYFLSSRSRPLEPVPTSRPRVIIPDEVDNTPTFDHLNTAISSHLALILLWKATVHSDSAEPVLLCGQHHVTLEKLNVSATMPSLPKVVVEQPPVKIIKEPEDLVPPTPDPAALDKLVKVSILSQHSALHDFSVNRLCVLPVTVVLQNCSDADLKIRLETKPPPKPVASVEETTEAELAEAAAEVAPPPPPDPPNPAPVFWLGQTSHRTRLLPGQHKKLALNVGVSGPGIYNLNVINVYVTSDVIQDVLQRPYGPSLLMVNNSAKKT